MYYISSLSICLYMDTGGFHSLTIINNAAVNIGAHIPFGLLFSFFKEPPYHSP